MMKQLNDRIRQSNLRQMRGSCNNALNGLTPPMIKQEEYTQAREMVIARQIARIIPDLKLVDAGDYVAYLHEECYANISDIIDAATELHFFPNTLRFAGGGDFVLDWDTPPTISLDMKFSNQGVSAAFRLTMSSTVFHIELDMIDFKNADENPEINTGRLITAFEDARITKILI